MGKIITSGEERRPRLICAHCKGEFIIDITGFNKDMTRIAQVNCTHCHRPMFMGILLLANVTQEMLFANIKQIMEAAGAANTLDLGESGQSKKILM